jgi:carbonic anhydrase/acetyltransferase-like protein (isoleucine patch superfamily)
LKRFLLTWMFFLIAINVFAEKTVYIPNDFNNNKHIFEPRWSYESANFVVFWGSKVGETPTNFNPETICDDLEKSYTKFVTEIGFCSDPTDKNLGKYKIIVVMNDTWPTGGPTGYAYGSQYDSVIGAMWISHDAASNADVLSHELTHALQCMIYIQENPQGGYVWEHAGFFWETHANFMRTVQFPSFAGADLPRWMGTSMFHLSSTRHHYSSFKWLMHLQHLDGIEMINRLWKESIANEHPLMTLMRLKSWKQSDLNDFIYDYAKREVTCDYPAEGFGAIMLDKRNQLKKSEPHFMWRFHTILTQVDETKGRYVVPDVFAPQDYGYNLIPLHPTDESRKVHVKFKGHTEVNNSEGWRYGFVAVDGTTPRYSPVYSADESEITFQMTENETELYLVVAGAPTSHKSYVWEPGWPKIKRYPYELRIAYAIPEGYQDGFRSQYKKNGSVHSNGSGWVASSASVATSVYVGPQAIVLGSSNISGNVRIENTAWVENATVKDNVTISGNANVWHGAFSGDAQILENAVLSYCTVSGNAIIKGNALEWGVTLDGSVVVGGDAEIGNSSNGVYLQCPHSNNGRQENDGKGADHYSNQDVNASYELFSDEEMEFKNPVGLPILTTNTILSIQLAQNYPNPFNPTTTIAYELLKTSETNLSVYNLLGQKVATLVNSKKSAGRHKILFNASSLPSGIYFYVLKTNDFIGKKKLVLLK